MNTIKFELNQIITTKDEVKEIWILKNTGSVHYINYNGMIWFLKENNQNKPHSWLMLKSLISEKT